MQFSKWGRPEWHSDCGYYQIQHSAKGRYYAKVLCCRKYGSPFWDFAGAHRPYRTLNAARKACEKNQQTWQKFIVLADEPVKGRKELAHQQIANSWVGSKKPTAGRILTPFPPVWVLPQLAPWLLKIVAPAWK